MLLKLLLMILRGPAGESHLSSFPSPHHFSLPLSRMVLGTPNPSCISHNSKIKARYHKKGGLWTAEVLLPIISIRRQIPSRREMSTTYYLTQEIHIESTQHTVQILRMQDVQLRWSDGCQVVIGMIIHWVSLCYRALGHCHIPETMLLFCTLFYFILLHKLLSRIAFLLNRWENWGSCRLRTCQGPHS